MKIKNFMAILGMALIMVAIIIGSCSAQGNMNYLKIKGEVLNDYKTNVIVYGYDEVSDVWNKISTKENKSKYNLRLATNKDYRIVFMSDSGPTKTVNIKSGDPGMYIEYLDIDFDDNDKYACMYQKNGYRYSIQTEIEYSNVASLE